MTIEETEFHSGYGQQVLVGNWQEERVANTAETTSDEGAAAALSSTFTRTIGAGTKLNDPNLYKSVARDTFGEPSARNNVKDDPATNLGPRERKAMEALMKEARDLTVSDATLKETRRAQHLAEEATKTIQRTSYVPKDMSEVTVGTRVMKDPDGRAAVRDPVFLSETRMVLKGDADRWIKQEGTLQTTGALFSARLPDQEVAVSIYSEAVATGKCTTSSINGGTLPISATAPFNKSCNFTKPITHYDKVVIDE